MKHFSFSIIFLFLLIFLASCGDTKNNQLIIGNWHATEWLIDGKPSVNNVADTRFSFSDKETYTYTNSGLTEKGTYKVENDMLFTTPEHQAEIMVKIMKLTKDSLVFDMNRSGQVETMTLLKN